MTEIDRPTKEQILAVHLTQDQLNAYHSMPRNDEETHKVGRHLLFCNDCLQRLPIPTREQFLQAIFGNEIDEDEF